MYIELAVLFKAGMEGNCKQAALRSLFRNGIVQIEEGLGQDPAVDNDQNHSCLLGHQQPPIVGRNRESGPVESSYHERRFDLGY